MFNKLPFDIEMWVFLDVPVIVVLVQSVGIIDTDDDDDCTDIGDCDEGDEMDSDIAMPGDNIADDMADVDVTVEVAADAVVKATLDICGYRLRSSLTIISSLLAELSDNENSAITSSIWMRGE